MVEINESNYHKILKKKLGNFENYEYMGGYTTKKNVIKNGYMKRMENEGIIYPELKWNCECSHWILQNCYIRNIITKEILVVGNCCIKYFGIKKKCITCKKIHKRTKFNICIDCEKEEKLKIKELKEQQKEKIKLENTIITFGMYKNKTIKFLFENNENYVRWCYTKNRENNNKIFKEIIEYLFHYKYEIYAELQYNAQN